MRQDLIEAVEFHKLDPVRYDRRGKIATFHIKTIPNQAYAYQEAALMIRNIINLLGSTYELNWNDEDNLRSYLFGEAQDCWVNRDAIRGEGIAVEPNVFPIIPVIRVDHKYWGEEQVKAFCDIIKVLAALHGWKVTISD